MVQRHGRTNHGFCGRTRREFLWQTGGGFASVALGVLLGEDGFLNSQAVAADGVTPYRNPMLPQAPHFEAKAKSVIFLYMYGGPSHVDTFDYKPALQGMDGKTVQVKTKGRGGEKNEGRIVEPRWAFHRYGESGHTVSTLFPHLSTCVDDLAFVKSMVADSPLHGSAMLQMNTGSILSGSPCLGSWTSYGLGTENQNLPGFVVMLDPRGGPISGAKNWTSGYMPATYQATVMRPTGAPILNLARPSGVTRKMQRQMLDAIREYNEAHQVERPTNSDLAARIASYELAFRMQSAAPEATDIAKESEATKEEYGLGGEQTYAFGRQCLLARRFAEAGVRFIQVSLKGWDHHGKIAEGLEEQCATSDKPIAALLTDLKVRGLLHDTLVLWGGEFGRTPHTQQNNGLGEAPGREHNPHGFTMWMAGGGVRGGITHGVTDDFGYHAVDGKVHINDLHATMLHLLGLDHERLTFQHHGRPFRLTDVAGVVVKEILA